MTNGENLFLTKIDEKIFSLIKESSISFSLNNLKNKSVNFERFKDFCHKNLSIKELDNLFFEYIHFKCLNFESFDRQITVFSGFDQDTKIFSVYRVLFELNFFLEKLEILEKNKKLKFS